jgi:hypothetical protein
MKPSDGPSQGTRREKSGGPVAATSGAHERPPGTAPYSEGAHAVQAVAPAAEKLFGGHAPEHKALCRPAEAPKEPAGHGWHSGAPSTENCPAAQDRGVQPAAAEMSVVPAGQVAHVA